MIKITFVMIFTFATISFAAESKKNAELNILLGGATYQASSLNEYIDTANSAAGVTTKLPNMTSGTLLGMEILASLSQLRLGVRYTTQAV